MNQVGAVVGLGHSVFDDQVRPSSAGQMSNTGSDENELKKNSANNIFWYLARRDGKFCTTT